MERKSKKRKTVSIKTLKELFPETKYTEQNCMRFTLVKERYPYEESHFHLRISCVTCGINFIYNADGIAMMFYERYSTKPHVCLGCEGEGNKIMKFFKIVNGKKVILKKLRIGNIL